MGKNKKAKVEERVESDCSNSEDSDESMEDINEQVNATFEGRNLEDIDYHGIKQLLLQSFLKAPVELSSVTDMLISQYGIGSVLKQSPEDEEEEMEDDLNEVYGVTTVLNLSAHRETPCVLQILDFLKTKAKKYADEATFNMFNSILTNNERLGLLINERFVNIPATIAAPMLSSLHEEINRKRKKSPEYNFQNYILICKTYKSKNDKGETSFANEEEMLFSVNSNCNFEYEVTKDCDVAVGGRWGSKEENILPFRKVLLVPADKMQDIITQINTFVKT